MRVRARVRARVRVRIQEAKVCLRFLPPTGVHRDTLTVHRNTLQHIAVHRNTLSVA